MVEETMDGQFYAVPPTGNGHVQPNGGPVGIGLFSYASHPRGGARMADEVGFGVVDDACEVFGSESLFCMDSSVIPTSFGVNPSLSISAVCERAVAKLVARAADFDLPAPPADLKHRPPGVHVGEWVKPG